ncbi:hypothetical protein FHL15_006863 [Xylaria flabelliformis]|uniref:Uncharacterized protein n=1 Tax=Xylaria flabelliformis TaxID=2512241 RepID=A0A553HWC6_9PEZI|nr:hypothetical protein FHL15_006863 [Xylaria flabelliformis]
MRRSRRAEFRETLIDILQVLFAILIFIVFVLAFVIQSEAIVLPPWTKTFQGATPEQQSQYSAALLSVILIITAIIVAAGAYLWPHYSGIHGVSSGFRTRRAPLRWCLKRFARNPCFLANAEQLYGLDQLTSRSEWLCDNVVGYSKAGTENAPPITLDLVRDRAASKTGAQCDGPTKSLETAP